MKVPENVAGDKLIRDYLARLTEVSLSDLPKGNRGAFVGRTRALIEQSCGSGRAADPERVRRVLAALGEPEELVRAEWSRIEAERIKASTGESSDVAAATAAAEGDPASRRPFTSRWRPVSRSARSTQPFPVVPPASQAEPAQGKPEGPASDSPTIAIPGAGASTPGRSGAGGTGSGSQQAHSAGPLFHPGHASEFAREAVRLARGHWLESAAIVLIGAGGLIFPVLPPLWLLGGGLALFSDLWDVRDKAVALFGPVLFALALSALVAGVAGGGATFSLNWMHQFLDLAGYLLRAGSVICAVYLAWRLQRGPRVKVPPWRR